MREFDITCAVEKAKLANYLVCQILVRLRYFINLDKTVVLPSQTSVFLGFILDSVEKCFRLTENKKNKVCSVTRMLFTTAVCNCVKFTTIGW